MTFLLLMMLWQKKESLIDKENFSISTPPTSPKRSEPLKREVGSAEVSDSKQQRISAVLLSDGRKIEVHTNEDEHEQKASERDPVIYENLTEFSDEDLKQAMKSEMESLESFETKEDVPLTSVEDSVISTAMTLLWVFVWKGFVKGRL